MNRRQIVALWVGITAFVLIGLFPPMIETREFSGSHQWLDTHVDMYPLVIRLVVVVVLTGGLLCSLRSGTQGSRWVGRLWTWAADSGRERYEREKREEEGPASQPAPARRHSGSVEFEKDGEIWVQKVD